MGCDQGRVEAAVSEGPPRLADYAPPGFVLHLMDQMPAPRHPESGEQLWERGIRLHGGQRGLLLEDYRFQQGTGGVRAGKSWVGGAKPFVDWCWRVIERGVRNDLWWVVGPDYEQTTEEMRHAHRLFTWAGVPHRFSTPQNQSWEISFPGMEAAIVSKTAHDVAAIAGKPVRGVVIAEAAQHDEATWDAARERVIETRGWVLMEGTFERAKQWYRKMARDWKRGTPDALGVNYPMPTWENLVLYPEGFEDPEIQLMMRTLTPDKFWERLGGEARQPTGLKMRYASTEYHVAHRYPALNTSFDPERPVYLAIDPGSSHAYAVLAIQMFGNIAWVIDAIYRWGRTSQQVIEETAQRPWAYKVDTAIMDIASRQRNANGEPVEEQWVNGWRKLLAGDLNTYMNFVPIDQGYDLHLRALLNGWPEERAKAEFDQDGKLRRVTDPDGPRVMWAPEAARCVFGGIVDDRYYEGEYLLHRIPERRDGSVPRDSVVDEDNDAIKAFNYFAYWAWRVTGDLRLDPKMWEPIPFEVVVN